MSQSAIQERKPIADQIEEANTEIEAVLAKCNPAALMAMSTLSQAATLAKGITLLREALTPEIMTRLIMPLQNSRLGFLTDRKTARNGTTEYSRDEVREVMIEGMLQGLRPVGNEINIIGGNCYAAKSGVKRLVEEWPGVSHVVLTPGVPEMHAKLAKTAILAMRATWIQDGERHELYRGEVRDDKGVVVDDTRFAIRVNDGMGPDAIIGKCERKMYAAILARLSGGKTNVLDGDAEAIETQGVTVAPAPAAPPPVQPEQDGKRVTLPGNGKKNKPTPKRDSSPKQYIDDRTGEVRDVPLMPSEMDLPLEKPMREPGEE